MSRSVSFSRRRRSASNHARSSGVGRRLRALHISAPVGEVLPDLLPAVDDRVRQIACLVLRESAGPELRVVRLARHRQLVERQDAHRPCRRRQVDVVAGVALLVVRLARALRSVELAAHQGDLGDSIGRPHEGRDAHRAASRWRCRWPTRGRSHPSPTPAAAGDRWRAPVPAGRSPIFDPRRLPVLVAGRFSFKRPARARQMKRSSGWGTASPAGDAGRSVRQIGSPDNPQRQPRGSQRTEWPQDFPKVFHVLEPSRHRTGFLETNQINAMAHQQAADEPCNRASQNAVPSRNHSSGRPKKGRPHKQ